MVYENSLPRYLVGSLASSAKSTPSRKKELTSDQSRNNGELLWLSLLLYFT